HRAVENVVVAGIVVNSLLPHRQRLEHHEPSHPPRDYVEPEQRIPQVVEDTHEQHQVELLLPACQIVDLQSSELHAIGQPEFAGRPPRLPQVVIVDVDAENVRTAARELEGV